MMNDLISRQAAIDAVNNIMPTKEGFYEPSEVLCELMQLPPAEPERKKGRWIQYDKRFPWRLHYKCSECGNYLDFSGVNAGRGSANFCPNCGAKMEGIETIK